MKTKLYILMTMPLFRNLFCAKRHKNPKAYWTAFAWKPLARATTRRARLRRSATSLHCKKTKFGPSWGASTRSHGNCKRAWFCRAIVRVDRRPRGDAGRRPRAVDENRRGRVPDEETATRPGPDDEDVGNDKCTALYLQAKAFFNCLFSNAIYRFSNNLNVLYLTFSCLLYKYLLMGLMSG